MESNDTLAIATGAETLDGANLQPSIDALLETSYELDHDIAMAPDVPAVQDIGKVQADLNDRALALTGAQIDLLSGQALVTAAHVNAATTAAHAAIETMKDWKKRIAVAGKLVDFVGAVLTGDGAKMVDAAFKLKDTF